jgi:transposase
MRVGRVARSLYRWHVRKFGGSRSPTAKNKAAIAVAHKLSVIIWHVLATGKPYRDLGADYLDRRVDPDRNPKTGRQTPSPRTHRHDRTRSLNTNT